jgi:hypothetical protein
LRYLRTESKRVRGDYLCTSPVSAALSARSLRSVGLAVWTALRAGSPGPWALIYAGLNAIRIGLLTVRATVTQLLSRR